MKKIAVAVMIILFISSHFETAQPSAADCLDACTTACVQKDQRLMQRCDRKCQIKCDPDSYSVKNGRAALQLENENLP
ncbi:uncharacterized protein LOC123192443 [Mangifera indica]|uniref:uncharacterized protein LOC123192443 n=1 Tax=Mangifera indica TaxID=29780 RepID=UPI001CFA4EA1|nr:uncharacterized protein LOC123192443 [Mangifera indica]